MADGNTGEQILAIARDLLAREGLGGVSFDAIARRLGRSKQAVLYWYPSKRALLAALYLPWLEAEAEAAVGALRQGEGAAAAVGEFVHAIAEFHLKDLDRFRMMYLVLQTTPNAGRNPDPDLLAEVHPITDRLYAAFAARLEGEAAAWRREAVAVHAAVLGLVMMVALADAVDDPLKHPSSALVDALVGRLTGG